MQRNLETSSAWFRSVTLQREENRCSTSAGRLAASADVSMGVETAFAMQLGSVTKSFNGFKRALLLFSLDAARMSVKFCLQMARQIYIPLVVSRIRQR